MDIDSEEIFSKRCYSCVEPVYDNLNISYNSSHSKIVLWNKYQIFVYEAFAFESPEKEFVPEFQVQLVLISNNCLVCLDSSGNIHTASLKFKSSTQNRLKIAFQPREQAIITCARLRDDYILSLKHDADSYLLCLHRMSTDFKLQKMILLLCINEHWPLGQNTKENYLLTSHNVDQKNYELLNKIFEVEGNFGNIHDLVVFSLDNFTVHSCFIFSSMDETVTLVELYTCPAEICNIEIVDSEELFVFIGLKMGTMIRLSLNDTSKAPLIVHLNTALYKMIALKDSLIYSDGITMWESKAIFSSNGKSTQFFVRNTFDFVKCGDQIISTTFTKSIYMFSVDDETVYLKVKTTDEYCSAEKLINHYDYLNQIFQEIDKNNELVKKLTKEQDCITALSLSNRQDLVTKALESSIMVFETYEEVSRSPFTLTEEIKEYFVKETWLFLVNIKNTDIFNTLNSILSNFSDSIIVFITFSSPQRILKTTSIQMEEPLKQESLLIPLKLMIDDITEINVNIKIILTIPGVYDQKQTWLVLYKKDIALTSEHFIKTSNKTTVSLKEPKESVEDLIHKTVLIQHGNIFNFTDVSKLKESYSEWSFYIKLPNDYVQIFKTDKHCKKYFSCSKTQALLQQWSTEEFLTSKNHITFTVGNDKLKLIIQNDGFTSPLLKVTGGNLKMVYNIRNFFSNMIYNDYYSKEPGKEFISSTFYTTVENLQKTVKSCITSKDSFEDFMLIMEQFEKNIIGALPL